MSWQNALRQEGARTSRSDWKAFMAMLARDAHVARRNAGMIVVQTFLQPLLFVFIFGRVMVRSGYMPESYKSLLLPGIMAISMVLTPMIFFGCTYYPWSALAAFPILQKVVLINPLVYASEGMRGTLVPQFPHLSLIFVLVALTSFDVLLLVAGLRQFRRKAVS